MCDTFDVFQSTEVTVLIDAEVVSFRPAGASVGFSVFLNTWPLIGSVMSQVTRFSRLIFYISCPRLGIGYFCK